MKFPGNSNTGIAIDDKEILRTTDRGQTWTPVVQISNAVDTRFVKLSFPTAAYGYAAAGDLLLKTTNAGQSWHPVTLPVTNIGLQFNTVSFVSSNIGYVLRDDDFTVFKTVNGGTGWTKMNDETVFPVAGSDLYFINDSTGLVASRYSYEIYKTTDNGMRWERCKRIPDYQNASYGLKRLFFYNSQTAWAGGAGAYLLNTTNAGGIPAPAAAFKIDTTNLTSTAVVHLKNYSKPAYQFKWYRNNVLFSTAYDASYTHDFFNTEDTITLIAFNGTEYDTAIQYHAFTLPPYRPLISSFDPVTGSTGTFVTISGSGFTQVNAVKFGGISAASFSVVSDNIIKATIANGATGTVSVADVYSGSGLAGFTYFAPPVAAPPVITSITPAAGPAGSFVTISGNNFDVTTAGNIVFFGAVKAEVTSASAGSIVCRIPAGASYEPVSIFNNTTGLMGESFKPFTVNFADSGNFSTISFGLITEIDNGYFSSAKDIDGDGKPDLVSSVYSQGVDSIAVFRNITSNNNFSFASKVNIGSIPKSTMGRFALNDLDGDGKPDISCATNGSSVIVARNTSTPGAVSFAGQQTIATVAGGTQEVAITDLDNDGKNDIAAACFDNQSIVVLRNTSTPGNFSFGQPDYSYSTGEAAKRIAVGDLDKDGKKDIVVFNDSYFSCFKNTSTKGSISFATRADFMLVNNTMQGLALVIADYDNDNKLDVVIFNDLNFCIYRNISTPGNIAFDTPLVVPISNDDGWGGTIANLSGDSKPDVLTGSQTLYQNTSTPGLLSNFSQSATYPHYSSAMSTADFNLDGKMDLIASSPNFSKIFVYKNQIGDPVDFEVCTQSNDAAGIGPGITGVSYQWQQDTGTGFSNLADNHYLTGSNSDVLYFLYVPPAWAGYKYRCIVDGKYSETFTIAFTNSWTGMVDTNWENNRNWSCGHMPGKYERVLISGGVVNVNSDAFAWSLKVNPGVIFTVKAGFKITIEH